LCTHIKLDRFPDAPDAAFAILASALLASGRETSKRSPPFPLPKTGKGFALEIGK
jgi:hypothetical protein